MAQKEFLSNAGLKHYDEKIKEYIGDHSSADIVALKEESPATAAHTVGSHLTYNSYIYEVKQPIAIGDTLVVGTNIDLADIAEGTVIYSDEEESGGSTPVVPQGVIIVNSLNVESIRRDKLKFGNGFIVTDDGTNLRIQIDLPQSIQNLGTAATKNYTDTIESEGTSLPTSGAVYSYINTMITQALDTPY